MRGEPTWINISARVFSPRVSGSFAWRLSGWRGYSQIYLFLLRSKRQCQLELYSMQPICELRRELYVRSCKFCKSAPFPRKAGSFPLLLSLSKSQLSTRIWNSSVFSRLRIFRAKRSLTKVFFQYGCILCIGTH